MKKPRKISVVYPILGVNRAAGYQQQPPFSCPDALNAWPRDTHLGRSRGGQRPGLASYGGAIGATPQWLGHLNVRTGSGTGYEQRLCGIAGGTLKYTTGSSWTSVGSAGPASGQTTAAPAQGKLYIPGSTNKVWDPNGSLATWSASAGSFPTGMTQVVTWADRMVCYGNPSAVNEVYFSRQGDPTDFDYTKLDQGRAVLLSAYYAGQIGEPVLACVPIHRECILLGCPNEIWVLRGNPAGRTSKLEPITRNIGILSPHAWCYTYDGGIAFLAESGLYYMPYGCGQQPVPISEGPIPDDLLAIDTSANSIAMAFDRTNMAVNIHVTPTSGDGEHWWWDFRVFRRGQEGGLWPMSLPTTMQPTAAANFVPASTTKDEGTAILGCQDGTTRHADRTGDDDGTEITSYVDIGPIRISGTIDDMGQVQSCRVVRSSDSDDFTAKISTGKTAEEAAAKTNSFSYTTADPSTRQYPRLRGHAAILSLESIPSTTDRWGFEEAELTITESGRMR